MCKEYSYAVKVKPTPPSVKIIETGYRHGKLLGPTQARGHIQSRDEQGGVGDGLGMIWIDFEVSEQEGLAPWQVAPAFRFHCYEHGVNLFKRLGIVKLEYPAFLRCIVLIKDTEVQGLLFVRAASPPRLERADVFDSNLLIQNVSVKNQRLPFRIENAAIWFLRRSITRDVVYLRDVQVSRSHQIPNVAVVGKKFFLLVNRLFP